MKIDGRRLFINIPAKRLEEVMAAKNYDDWDLNMVKTFRPTERDKTIKEIMILFKAYFPDLPPPDELRCLEEKYYFEELMHPVMRYEIIKEFEDRWSERPLGLPMPETKEELVSSMVILETFDYIFRNSFESNKDKHTSVKETSLEDNHRKALEILNEIPGVIENPHKFLEIFENKRLDADGKEIFTNKSVETVLNENHQKELLIALRAEQVFGGGSSFVGIILGDPLSGERDINLFNCVNRLTALLFINKKKKLIKFCMKCDVFKYQYDVEICKIIRKEVRKEDGSIDKFKTLDAMLIAELEEFAEILRRRDLEILWGVDYKTTETQRKGKNVPSLKGAKKIQESSWLSEGQKKKGKDKP